MAIDLSGFPFPKEFTFCVRDKQSMHLKCPRLRDMGTKIPVKTFSNEDIESFACLRAICIENGLVNRAIPTVERAACQNQLD